MPTVISNGRISDCSGTAISLNGKNDTTINSVVFNNNNADIKINVAETSNISLNDIESFNCKTISIDINTYDNTIEGILNYARGNDSFTNEELGQIRELLNNLKDKKKEPKKVKIILKEIYAITKSCAPNILSFLLKYLSESHNNI